MFRKLIIILSLLLFLVLTGITFFKINRSLTPLNIPNFIFSDSVTEPADGPFRILPPLITDRDKLFFTVQSEDERRFISGFNPIEGTLMMYAQLPDKNSDLSGFAADTSARFFLISQSDSVSSGFLLKDDTTFFMIQLPPLNHEKITSVNFSEGNPEIATIVNTAPSYFKLYSVQISGNMNWLQKSVRRNPFFVSISKPLTAYFRNTWLYLTTSNFYRRDSLYVKTPAGSSNIMVFRNNLSFHFEDIRVSEPSFHADQLDMTVSGMLNPDSVDLDKHFFNPTTLTIKKHQHPKHAVSLVPVFFTSNYFTERFFLYHTHSPDTLVIQEDQIIRHITLKTNQFSERVVFSVPKQEDQDFAISPTGFGNIYLLPFQDGYVFITDNGNYCHLGSDMSRMDNIQVRSKFVNFILKHFQAIKDQPKQLGSWAMPVAIVGFPALTVLVLFFFFIFRVFLTPKRPAYSSRKRKKTPFSVFLFPACLLWLIATGITFIHFLTQFKLL